MFKLKSLMVLSLLNYYVGRIIFYYNQQGAVAWKATIQE